MPANELSLDGKSILDMCCGSRMFWFDKEDERAVFSENHTLCDGRKLVISPDLIADFTALPFADCTFPVVVFDPPHPSVESMECLLRCNAGNTEGRLI